MAPWLAAKKRGAGLSHGSVSRDGRNSPNGRDRPPPARPRAPPRAAGTPPQLRPQASSSLPHASPLEELGLRAEDRNGVFSRSSACQEPDRRASTTNPRRDQGLAHASNRGGCDPRVWQSPHTGRRPSRALPRCAIGKRRPNGSTSPCVRDRTRKTNRTPEGHTTVPTLHTPCKPGTCQYQREATVEGGLTGKRTPTALDAMWRASWNARATARRSATDTPEDTPGTGAAADIELGRGWEGPATGADGVATERTRRCRRDGTAAGTTPPRRDTDLPLLTAPRFPCDTDSLSCVALRVASRSTRRSIWASITSEHRSSYSSSFSPGRRSGSGGVGEPLGDLLAPCWVCRVLRTMLKERESSVTRRDVMFNF